MAIERAAVLYLRNSTTVDTGTGIDVRVLDNVNAAVADQTQSFTYTHTQDSIERTFDPATAVGAGNTNNAGTTLFKTGWALALSDMTPADDTNCNCYLPAGTLTVNLYLRSNQTGGTYISGSFAPTARASLWRYNPSTDTGTLIAAGTASPTWAVTGGDNNTFKTVAVSIAVASGVEFAQGEVLLLQVGMNSGTIPNPTLGTGTFTITLEVDTNNTNITWAANQNITQVCTLSNNLQGVGLVTRGALPIAMSRSVGGTGTITSTKVTVAAKTFNLVGAGTISKQFTVGIPRDVAGRGAITMSRVVTAAKSFALQGVGTITRQFVSSLARNVTGRGTITLSKLVTAAKTFNLVGVGTPTYSKFTIANRSFNLQGKGAILTTGPNASTITIPIDEVPDGGGGGDIIIVKKSFIIFDE